MTAYELQPETKGNQMEECLESTAGGIVFPISPFPNNFLLVSKHEEEP